jgi:hypothetical protein
MMSRTKPEVKYLRDENARLKKLVADLRLDKGHPAVGDQKTPWVRMRLVHFFVY